jgi:hypothetical protein
VAIASTLGEVVPVVFVNVPPDVNELCHCINPVLPVKFIIGVDVLAHIIALPEVIDAVPATDVRSTLTVDIIAADGHTPFVTTAL